jgi:hypothetical protein
MKSIKESKQSVGKSKEEYGKSILSPKRSISILSPKRTQRNDDLDLVIKFSSGVKTPELRVTSSKSRSIEQ